MSPQIPKLPLALFLLITLFAFSIGQSNNNEKFQCFTGDDLNTVNCNKGQQLCFKAICPINDGDAQSFYGGCIANNLKGNEYCGLSSTLGCKCSYCGQSKCNGEEFGNEGYDRTNKNSDEDYMTLSGNPFKQSEHSSETEKQQNRPSNIPLSQHDSSKSSPDKSTSSPVPSESTESSSINITTSTLPPSSDAFLAKSSNFAAILVASTLLLTAAIL